MKALLVTGLLMLAVVPRAAVSAPALTITTPGLPASERAAIERYAPLLVDLPVRAIITEPQADSDSIAQMRLADNTIVLKTRYGTIAALYPDTPAALVDGLIKVSLVHEGCHLERWLAAGDAEHSPAFEACMGRRLP